MALVTVSNRDRKMIIWNFMEELWENYQNAIENNLPTSFKIENFYDLGLLGEYLTEIGVRGSSDKIVLDTLKVYAKETGYIKIRKTQLL